MKDTKLIFSIIIILFLGLIIFLNTRSNHKANYETKIIKPETKIIDKVKPETKIIKPKTRIINSKMEIIESKIFDIFKQLKLSNILKYSVNDKFLLAKVFCRSKYLKCDRNSLALPQLKLCVTLARLYMKSLSSNSLRSSTSSLWISIYNFELDPWTRNRFLLSFRSLVN